MAGARWLEGDGVRRFPCPVCGHEREKPGLVETDGWSAGRIRFHSCPGCGSVVRDQDFGPPPAGGEPFSAVSTIYVEQGAGIDVIVEALARVAQPGVRRLLEIGCNYGFALDFARTTYGWDVTGIDPSQAARTGRDELSLPIRCEELAPETDLGPPFDLVLASEVIEHLAAPRTLTRSAARHLAPGGVLALTTPNAAGVRPGGDPLELERILSFGLHEVVFTASALRDLLRSDGLAHVLIEETPATLRAFASRDPAALERAREARPFDRALYRRWLDERARSAPAGSALASGMAYRHFKECVNAGDAAAAGPSRQRLKRVLADRYRVDLDDPTSLVRAAAGAAPDDLGQVVPSHATGALFFSAILALNHEGRPAEAAELFQAAWACGVERRRALPWFADGETADLMQQSLALAARARASVEPERAAREALALEERGLSPAEAVTAAGQVLVVLVNGGHYAAAARLAPRLPLGRVTDPSAAFCLGILALNHAGDAPGAARWFGRSYALALAHESARRGAGGILWPARWHEALALVRAGRREEARAIVTELGRPHAGLPPVPDELVATSAGLLSGTP